jgi:hypothetical protein
VDANHLENVFELTLVVEQDDIVGEEIDIDDAEDFIIVIDYGQSKKAIFREKLAGTQNRLPMLDRDGGTDHNRRDFRLGVAGNDVSYGDDARETIMLVGNVEIKDIFGGGIIPDGFYGVSHGFIVFKRDEIGPHIGGDRFLQIMVAQFGRHYTPFDCDYTIKAGRNSIMLTILNLCGFVFSAKIED